jgi:hypothetical protein
VFFSKDFFSWSFSSSEEAPVLAETFIDMVEIQKRKKKEQQKERRIRNHDFRPQLSHLC